MPALLSDLIDLYLEDCALRGLSSPTLTAYALDLRRLTDVVGKDRPLSSLAASDLDAFAAHCGRSWSTATHRRALTVARLLFRFGRQKGLLACDPTARLILPRLVRPLLVVPTVKQIERLCAVPDTGKPGGLRLAALLSLLYGSGLRIAEGLAVERGDVQQGSGYLRTRKSKGGHERLVPVSPRAEQLVLVQQQHAPGSVIGVSQRWARILVKRAGARVGLKIHPHLLRHAFATHLLQRGAELRAVQAMLGHLSLSSTQIYLHLVDSDLRAVYRRCHPRA